MTGRGCLWALARTRRKYHQLTQATLHIRPHAREILEELSEDFEILVFTSSNKEYAKEVVKRLDPSMKYITFLLHRDHCNIRCNV